MKDVAFFKVYLDFGGSKWNITSQLDKFGKLEAPTNEGSPWWSLGFNKSLNDWTKYVYWQLSKWDGTLGDSTNQCMKET